MDGYQQSDGILDKIKETMKLIVKNYYLLIASFSLLNWKQSIAAESSGLLRGTEQKDNANNNNISGRNLQQVDTSGSACGFPCGERASCIVNNDDGTGICVCDEGWDTILDPKDGRFLGCKDRDECVEDKPCGQGAICVDHDPPAMFSCICPDDGPKDVDGNCIELFAKSIVATPLPSSMPSSAPSTPAPSYTNGITYRDTCPDTENENIIISQTFDDGSSSSWSNPKTFAMANGNIFLGPYYKSDSNPSQTISIDATGVSRVGISFDFYEIGSFDGSGKNGPDTLSVQVSGDITDTVNLGSFHHNSDDTGKSTDTSSNGITWNLLHTPTDESPQTGLFESWKDQHHVVYLDIPRSFFASSGQFKITISWSLTGALDEAVGIDNFKVSQCVDTVPSMTPSSSPTSRPTPSPTPMPTLPIGVCGNPITGPGCEVNLLTAFISPSFRSSIVPYDSNGNPRIDPLPDVGAVGAISILIPGVSFSRQIYSPVYHGDRIDAGVNSVLAAYGVFVCEIALIGGGAVSSETVPHTVTTAMVNEFVTVITAVP